MLCILVRATQYILQQNDGQMARLFQECQVVPAHGSRKWYRYVLLFLVKRHLLMYINQIDTNEKTKELFAVKFKLHYECPCKCKMVASHSPAGNLLYEILIRGDDLRNVQKYKDVDGVGPSLAAYLRHVIPRRRITDHQYQIFSPFHLDKPKPCSSDCPDSAAFSSISTAWPLLLRVMPIWQDRPPDETDVHDVECPLCLELGSDAVYTLVGRVIFTPSPSKDGIGHYQSQVRIGDLIYLYDDLAGDGVLKCIGSPYLLEKFNVNTTTVFYVRNSIASVSSTSHDTVMVTNSYSRSPHGHTRTSAMIFLQSQGRLDSGAVWKQPYLLNAHKLHNYPKHHHPKRGWNLNCMGIVPPPASHRTWH